jgi:D-alanyl-D-alanine carboxypeptidase
MTRIVPAVHCVRRGIVSMGSSKTGPLRSSRRDRRARGAPGRALLMLGAATALGSLGCTLRDRGPDPLPQAIVNRVDSVMAEYRRMRSVPGLSLTIVRRGRILLSRGYGWADTSGVTPTSDETIFELGSIKKPLTAAVILRMTERGQVRLSDPVEKWVTSIRVPGSPVRIRDMLSQVSGLPELDDAETITRLDFEPGTRWAYSNANFDRLDRVVGAVDGRTFADYVAEEFSAPMGLTSLGMCRAEQPRPAHMARGHTLQNGVIVTTGDACWLRGSTRDLAVWLDALFAGRILGRESLRAMTTPIVLRDGTVAEYGYGLFLRPYRGMRRFSHTGHVEGFSAAFGFYPDSRTTIAVAGNSDSLFDPDGVEMAVAAALFGMPAEERAEVRLGDSGRFAGTYDGGTVWFRLESKGQDSLRLTMYPPARPDEAYFSTDLVPVDTGEYAGADSPAAVGVVFQVPQGDAQAVTGRVFAVGIPWDVKRVAPPGRQ